MVIRHFELVSPDQQSADLLARIGEVNVLASISGGDATTSYVDLRLSFAGNGGYFFEKKFRVSKETPIIQFNTHINYDYCTAVTVDYINAIGVEPVVQFSVVCETVD